mgnify:CR=1 FL=1
MLLDLSSCLGVRISLDAVRQDIKSLLQRAMGISLVPLEVEREKLDGNSLAKGPAADSLVGGLATKLDEAAEFDAGMAVAVKLARLGCGSEEGLVGLLSDS